MPSISTWLRTVRDPLVAGFFEASSETYRALEAAGSPKADRMAVRAARHILWEQRESAAYSIVGAEAEGEVGLALPSRITPVERAPRVEADADVLAVLGDLVGRAALCDLLRRDMETKGAEPREDVHAFAVNYVEGSRADVALHMKLRRQRPRRIPGSSSPPQGCGVGWRACGRKWRTRGSSGGMLRIPLSRQRVNPACCK